ncbi:MAG TPA: universal stress protein [Thermodesulfobacteriota bacterium]|nr:universal stress protein [Thermodesulfobacteriota bacterium]
MRKIKKIIWATDGSEESKSAFSYAVFLAKEFGSEVIGIHVAPVMIPMPEQVLYESKLQDWTKKVEENFTSGLTRMANEMASQEIKFQGTVLKGEPHKEIIEFARREKADLIVMGKRGLGLMDRIFVGSTTLRVLRKSKIPILSVKKRDEEGTRSIRNILVPLDISDKVDSAVVYALELAKKLNAQISIVYVFRLDAYAYQIPPGAASASPFEIPPSVFGVFEDLVKISSDKLKERVEDIKAKYNTSGLEINAEVVQAINPSVAIADYASGNDVDLIVINTHARKGIRRLFLGSVTEQIIREADCPVLVLRP